MKKLLKLALWLGGGLVLLVVIGLIVAFMYINSIAKTGIERGGTWAMGVPTRVSSVSVGWGDFGLKGLNIDNPPGYSSQAFLKLGTGDVNVKMNSLREPLVDIPKVELDNIAVRLEKAGGKGNYETILDNIAKHQRGQSSPSSGSEKKFLIRELKLKNVNVHCELIGSSGNAVANAVGQAANIDVAVGDVVITNLGQAKGQTAVNGMTLADLSAVIVQAVLTAAVERGGGRLPADIGGDLKGKLTALNPLQDLSIGGIDAIKGTGLEKEAEKALDGVKKGIGGLLDGGKKDEKKK